MEALKSELEASIRELSVAGDKMLPQEAFNSEQLKKLKKKLKKYAVEPKEASLNDALEKVSKIAELLYKNYEEATKFRSQMVSSRDNCNGLTIEAQKAGDQLKTSESLHALFMKKYNEELKAAQDYEAQGQVTRTKIIEELQQRVKTVQEQYEESGKLKIEKFRENEQYKNEMQRLEPHVVTSEALLDAQLKKKEIEISIEMTSLKQKVEMIESYKKLGDETKGKLEISRENAVKIEERLKILDGKIEEHNLAITKAHLVIDQYKKVMNSIHEIWDKSQKEAMSIRMKLQKSEEALRNLTDEEARLRKELDTQKAQLEGLKNLERTLTEQLKNL